MARNVVIDRLLKQIDRLNKRVVVFRAQCDHLHYKILAAYDDHDGYSLVPVTWYEHRKCEDCDAYFTVKTSTKDHR